MQKPEFFFYSFPTGGPKFALWPLSNGTHRLECNGQEIGAFGDIELALVNASRRFSEMHGDADLAKTAEQMLDLDWWERSPTTHPEEVSR